MISLLLAGEAITLSDVGRRWGVGLVDPQVPPRRRIRDEDAMATVCTRHPVWATLFLTGVLAHLVRTLPATDPWRHLSARIVSSQQEMVRGQVPRPPARTGAVLPDGRAFGGLGHPDFVGSDPELDVDFAVLADGLSPEAAALFAFASDGWNTARSALTLLRQDTLVDAVWAPGTTTDVRISTDAGEQLWTTAESAIRWAVHRRRLIHASQPVTTRPYASDIARGGADELPRDICWAYASHADSITRSGTTPVAMSTVGAEIAADTLGDPVAWPTD